MELSAHLEWLVGRLLANRNRLKALCESGQCECVLSGVVWTSGTSAHVRLEARHVEMLVDLQLGLQLEFADYGDNDDG
jgi:hypothetical protein